MPSLISQVKTESKPLELIFFVEVTDEAGSIEN